MAQFLRPDSTVDAGSWGGTYADVDEVTPSDTDFTESNKAASTHQMTLSNPAATPDSGTCTIRWRGRRRLTNKSAEVTIEVWNGTTAMVTGATETKTDPLGTFVTWEAVTFSTTDVTDFNDLQVRLIASATPAVDFDVSWIEIEVPDGSTVHQDDGADTVDLTDSATTRLDATESGSETADLSDSAVGTWTGERTGSEQVDLSDSAVAGLLSSESGSEVVELSDSAAAAHTKGAVATESAELSDTTATVLTARPEGTEGAELSDTGTGVLTAPESGAEGVDLSDSAVAGLLSTASGTEGAELSDSATGILVIYESVTDGVELSDSPVPISTMVESVGEGAEFGDSGAGTVPSAVPASYCKIIFGS